MITSSAPLLYTAEGGHIAQWLWRETMLQLSFVGVEDTVKPFDVVWKKSSTALFLKSWPSTLGG
jgi:hypothetical protein